MLIDTHSHLHFRKYDDDRNEVHARMAEFGVKTITVGTAMNTSRSAVEYADSHADTWASVGFHPEHVTSDFEDEDEVGALDEPFETKKLERIASLSPRVIAIGETGLDYSHLQKDNADFAADKKKQLEVFMAHVEVAANLNKTLIIHTRDAMDDMLQVISDIRQDVERLGRGTQDDLRIAMHSFTGTWQQAQILFELGCYIGIGGIVTFKPRKDTAPEDTLMSIVQKMPLERLLLETDAPWLAPAPVRGTRNEPTNVRHIADFVAKARGMSLQEISDVTTKNAQICFNCDFGF